MNRQLVFLINKSLESLNSSNLDSSELYLKQALRLEANNPHVLSLLGVIAAQRGHYSDALKHLNNSIKFLPKNSIALSNLGNVFLAMKNYTDSIDAYDKSIEIDAKNHEVWYNKGIALHQLKHYEEAITHYDRALSLKPNYANGWYNKGIVLNELKRYEEAIAHYDRALNLKPDYAECWYNKGIALHQLKHYEEAITHYDQALNLKPDFAEGWHNKGTVLNELKRHEEAILHYEKAISLKPDNEWTFGDLVHAKMKICSWSGLEDSFEKISKKLNVNEKVILPFPLLALNDDPSLHKKSSEIYIQSKYPFSAVLGPISKRQHNKKIRVGYFSADFKSHPVSFLTSELYEIHDRQRFEVFAFSLQKAPLNDEMNLRLRGTFDQFLDVDHLSDQEIAQLARDSGLDIAVDLGGHTQYSRTGIFSYRAAPIQVNWLGFPGTMGANFMDYIFADKILIPEAHKGFYVEKVAYLPNTYMVDDSKRIPSSRMLTRQEYGLPQNALIFCCFNNSYKFNSQVLDLWSSIMRRVGQSILWIPENNEMFKGNITAEFENRGLDRSRLFFAKRVESVTDHLARYRLADLFLDTFPYNAHSTAVDSLKVGTPLLTMMGRSFASRVAASLLSEIGLPELITTSQVEYEDLAVQLATNPQKLNLIKEKLVKNRYTTPLFDSLLFTKHLEAAYVQMYEHYHAGLAPDHIMIH